MVLSRRMVLPLAVAALAAAALAGCSVAVEPDNFAPPPTTLEASGTVTLDWLVAGRTDPGLCAAYGATHVELVVYDATGATVARQYARCESFSLTVPLPAGTYTADATLVDPNSNALSVTKPLEAIEVVPGTDLAINLDFPSSSML